MVYKLTFVLMCLMSALVIGLAQPSSKELSEELERLMAENSIVGCGLSLYDQGGTLYKRGFGYADVETSRPYTERTVQKIASISKVFLGTALMIAKELKLLDLDDQVNDYLPFALVNPNFSDTEITIRHLATHTSGLKRSKSDLKALVFPTPIPPIHKKMPMGVRRIFFKRAIKTFNRNADMPMERFIQNMYAEEGAWYHKKKLFSKDKPGTKRIYSNNGAALLAMIIEEAAGISYPAFVHKYILEPLQMENTCFDFEITEEALEKSASLYHMSYKVPKDYKLIIYPAGGLTTNVEDLSAFYAATVKGYRQGNRILSHAGYLEMLKKQINSVFDQGILWEVYDESIGHAGDIAGVTTFAYFNKATEVGYTLLCNAAAAKNMDSDLRAIIDVLDSHCREIGQK